VVRRLVEHENVRVLQAQDGKRDARLLAARQERHALQAGGARDAEGAEVAAVLLVLAAGEARGHEADGALREVERVDVVLGEEGEAEARVALDDAAGGLERADEQLERRRLAGAVGPHDADAAVELHVEVHVAQDGGPVGRVAERHVLHLDDGRGQLLHVAELEVHRVLGLGRLEHGHALELLDARLRLGRLGRVVAELVDEGWSSSKPSVCYWSRTHEVTLEVSTLAHLLLVLANSGLAALGLGGVEGVLLWLAN